MSHKTTIIHETRKAMGLSIGQFCVADAIHQIREEIITEDFLSKYLDISIYHVQMMCDVLVNLGYVKISPRSKKYSVTAKWRDDIKVSKEEKEPVSKIVTLMRKEVESRSTEYFWSAKDAMNAKLLSKKISYSFQKKQNRLPDETEMFNSFLLILNELPTFYADKLDIAMINSNFNNIISQIKANHVKRIATDTGIGSSHHSEAIQHALSDINGEQELAEPNDWYYAAQRDQSA